MLESVTGEGGLLGRRREYVLEGGGGGGGGACSSMLNDQITWRQWI